MLLIAEQLKNPWWFLQGNFVKLEHFVHEAEAQNGGGESQTLLILCGLLIRECSVC